MPSDDEFVSLCLRLIERLRERGTISADQAVELQLDLYRATGR